MKDLTAFFLGVVVLMFQGCFDKDKSTPDSTIEIVNNSNEGVVCYFDFNVIGDSLLPVTTPFPTKENIELHLIKANSSKNYPDAWKNAFKEAQGKILMLHLFSKDSLESIPWSQIQVNYIVLKRYDLTVDSLVRKNWTIEYP